MFDENRIVSRFLEVDEELYRGREYFRKERRANRLAHCSDSDYYDSDSDSDSDYNPIPDYLKSIAEDIYDDYDPVSDYLNRIAEDRYDDNECIEI